MDKSVASAIEACVELERNVADLYAVFHAVFPEHADFWMRLCIEEQNHAALFNSGHKYFAPIGKFPADLTSVSLNSLQIVNDRVRSLVARYRQQSPSVEEAFGVALAIEESAGEIHFQRFMKAPTQSPGDELFRRLNRDDKDHAERLRGRMRDFGIPIKEDSHDNT